MNIEILVPIAGIDAQDSVHFRRAHARIALGGRGRVGVMGSEFRSATSPATEPRLQNLPDQRSIAEREMA